MINIQAGLNKSLVYQGYSEWQFYHSCNYTHIALKLIIKNGTESKINSCLICIKRHPGWYFGFSSYFSVGITLNKYWVRDIITSE